MQVFPIFKNFTSGYKFLRFEDENKNFLDLNLFECKIVFEKNSNKFNLLKVEQDIQEPAYLIHEDCSYDIYYKNELILKIEPISFSTWTGSSCGSGKHLGLSLAGKKINIPDNVICYYDERKIEKTKLDNNECFDISKIGVYRFYLDKSLFYAIETYNLWHYTNETNYKLANFNIKYV